MVEKGAHLWPEARKLLALSRTERLNALEKDLWIGYPAALKILDRLMVLIRHAKRHRMPNVLVISPTNNGKTMIKEKFCKWYRADYETYSDPGGENHVRLKKQPIISIQMPSSPDIKTFWLTIAESIGKGAYYAHSPRPYLQMEIYQILKGLEVNMIIIDELHNVLAGSSRQQLEFLNLLRHMGNELQVPLVCFGIRDAYLAIKRDPQLENRFEPLILPLWEEGRDLNSLLKSFVALLPLEKNSELVDPKIVTFLLRKSEGVIGEMATILKMAAGHAIRSQREMIDLNLLEAMEYLSPSERTKVFERAIL